MVVRCVKRPRTGATEREASEIRASSQEQETEEAITIAAECLSCRLAERAAFFSTDFSLAPTIDCARSTNRGRYVR